MPCRFLPCCAALAVIAQGIVLAIALASPARALMPGQAAPPG